MSEQESLSSLLVKLLLVNDDIKEFSDKISVKLSSNTLLLLKTVLKKSPSSLDNVMKNINEILKDGKIDHKDIPNIVVLVTDFYLLDIKSVVKNQKVDDIVDFIQFLMKVIVDLNYVKVRDKEETFFVIDSSSALLRMMISVSTRKCLFPCFS